MKDFVHPDRDLPSTVVGEILVSTVRVTTAYGYDEVTVWNRGGNAGTLKVDVGDGEKLAALLLPEARRI